MMAHLKISTSCFFWRNPSFNCKTPTLYPSAAPRKFFLLISSICEGRSFTTLSDLGSSQISTNSYAVIDHTQAYVESMANRHGKQLSLAYNESLRVLKKEEARNYFRNRLKLEEKQLEKQTAGLDDNANENDDDLEDEQKNDVEEEEESEYDEDDVDHEDDIENGMVLPRTQYLKPSDRAAYKAGAPCGGNFAIVRLAKSNQFKVTIDDVIICNKLKPVDYWRVGAIISIPATDILLVGSTEKTYIGMPCVNSAEVIVRVEEITRDKTVIVFKKRRRKNSKRKNGFRREVTFLRVLDIRLPAASSDSTSYVEAA